MKKLKLKKLSNEPKQLRTVLKKADDLLDNEKWPEVIEILEPVQKEFPKNSQILWNLAECHANMNRFQRFAYYMEKLSTLEPQNPNVIYYLADAYLFSEYFSLALRNYQKYLKRWSDHEFSNEA